MYKELTEHMNALKLTKTDNLIVSLIGEGKDDGISLYSLSVLTHLPDRELRQHIESLRRDGIIILSGREGYYFPSSIEEIEEYVGREEKRARSIFYTLKAPRLFLERRRGAETRGEN